MNPGINLFLLTVFCTLGAGHGFVQRTKMGDPHITGGKEVEMTEIPYMASIRKFFHYHCGASIIGKYYVLTAAHCFKSREWTIFYGVAAGTSHINKGENYFVRSISEHPEFDPKTLDYDVAVVKIWYGFNFDTTISPIVTVDARSTLQPRDTLVVSGWGLTSEHALTANDKLLKTEVQYFVHPQCEHLYSDGYGFFTDRMFCAGVPGGGRDTCKGDSGGPIVDLKSGKQVGIVSWGAGCGHPKSPGVYTKLSHPEIWQFVDENTKNL